MLCQPRQQEQNVKYFIQIHSEYSWNRQIHFRHYYSTPTNKPGNVQYNENYLVQVFNAIILIFAHKPIIRVLFRKKKKDKEKTRHLEEVVMSQNDEEIKTKKTYLAKRTPAQIAFDKMQEKRVSHADKCEVFRRKGKGLSPNFPKFQSQVVQTHDPNIVLHILLTHYRHYEMNLLDFIITYSSCKKVQSEIAVLMSRRIIPDSITVFVCFERNLCHLPAYLLFFVLFCFFSYSKWKGF